MPDLRAEREMLYYDDLPKEYRDIVKECGLAKEIHNWYVLGIPAHVIKQAVDSEAQRIEQEKLK